MAAAALEVGDKPREVWQRCPTPPAQSRAVTSAADQRVVRIGGLVVGDDGQPSRATAKGRKISAAKRGRITRSELGVSLPQAAKIVGLSKEPFRALVVPVGDAGVFHGIPIREGRGTGWRFDPVELEEDRKRAPRCSFPACDKVAGPSRRCGDHAARVKYETVELVCQWKSCGRRFTRPGSWLRELDGRGHYCSNECKGAAAYEARRDDFREPFTFEESRAYHAAIARKIAAKKLLDRRSAQRSSANRYRYSASHMCAHGPSELRVIDGSPRRVYEPAELASWQPPWAEQLDRRVNIAYGRTKDPGVHGRRGGRDRKWSPEQEADVRRYDAEGKTQAQIQYLTGLSRAQVRYILGR